MDLEILSLGEARFVFPEKKTYIIRLGEDLGIHKICPLRVSENWVGIDNYCFERVLNGKPKSAYLETEFFDYEDAERLLSNFVRDGGDAQKLIVHSHSGAVKAPAVGKAMNDIYGWGHDGLEEMFPHYDIDIYRVLMEVAGRG